LAKVSSIWALALRAAAASAWACARSPFLIAGADHQCLADFLGLPADGVLDALGDLRLSS
jgi:hypothetical protein